MSATGAWSTSTATMAFRILVVSRLPPRNRSRSIPFSSWTAVWTSAVLLPSLPSQSSLVNVVSPRTEDWPSAWHFVGSASHCDPGAPRRGARSLCTHSHGGRTLQTAAEMYAISAGRPADARRVVQDVAPPRDAARRARRRQRGVGPGGNATRHHPDRRLVDRDQPLERLAPAGARHLNDHGSSRPRQAREALLVGIQRVEILQCRRVLSTHRVQMDSSRDDPYRIAAADPLHDCQRYFDAVRLGHVADGLAQAERTRRRPATRGLRLAGS